MVRGGGALNSASENSSSIKQTAAEQTADNQPADSIDTIPVADLGAELAVLGDDQNSSSLRGALATKQSITVIEGSGPMLQSLTLPENGEYFQFQVTELDTSKSNFTFAIPVSGRLNNINNSYNWNIDWGDESAVQTASGTGSTSSSGISHTYAGLGPYTITIMPNDPDAYAWFGAFGFYGNTDGANAAANKQKITAILSGFTPRMTRIQAQIGSPSGTQPSYEWTYTFYGCTNLVATGPGWSSGWNNVTTVGRNFANYMFYNCASLTMNEYFNLPQSLTTVGSNFASSMFANCTSLNMNGDFNLPQGIIGSVGDGFANEMFLNCASLTMNDEFNMPQGIITVGGDFAYNMFEYCTSLRMNDEFNLPQGITTVGDNFALNIFFGCTNLITMNEEFNLPQGITTVGNSFARQMFYGCTNLITMNDEFNLPQGITTVGNNFAYMMFYQCTNLTMNDKFNLPQGITAVGNSFAYYMFGGCTNLTMNEDFNLPQDLTTVGNYFAGYMFSGCTNLTMNDKFNLPQGITTVGTEFADYMFSGCTNLTMNDDFNLPQGIITVGRNFAYGMFYQCNGLLINGVFTFPRIALASIGNSFTSTFYGVPATQPRTARSIINNPGTFSVYGSYTDNDSAYVTTASGTVMPYTLAPPAAFYTFTNAFKDLPYIDLNWGGTTSGGTQPNLAVSYVVGSALTVPETLTPYYQPTPSVVPTEGDVEALYGYYSGQLAWTANKDLILLESITPGDTLETFVPAGTVMPRAQMLKAQILEDTVFTAQAMPRTVDVTYDSDGGSAVANGSGTYGGTLTTPPTEPTRAGYIFKGWEYKDAGYVRHEFEFGASGTGTPLDKDHGVIDENAPDEAGNATLTLYAKWATAANYYVADADWVDPLVGSQAGSDAPGTTGAFDNPFATIQHVVNDIIQDETPTTIHILTDLDMGSTNPSNPQPLVTIPANKNITIHTADETVAWNKSQGATETRVTLLRGATGTMFKSTANFQFTIADIILDGNSTQYSNANGTLVYGNAAQSSIVTLSGAATLQKNETLGTFATLNCSTVIMNDTSLITHNKVNDSVGGIRATNITLNDSSSVTYNESGGIYSSSGTLQLYDQSSVTYNTSNNIYYGGGGITLDGSKVILNNQSFVSHNTAVNYGGGIFTYTGNSVILYDTASISDNTAKYGGGIYGVTATVTLNGSSSVKDNHATANGGGIYTRGSTVTLNNASSVKDNDAVTNGGGIYAEDYTKIIIPAEANVTFSGNTANGLYRPEHAITSGIATTTPGVVKSISPTSWITNTGYGGDFEYIENTDLNHAEYVNTVFNNYDINYTTGYTARKLTYDANGGMYDGISTITTKTVDFWKLYDNDTVAYADVEAYAPVPLPEYTNHTLAGWGAANNSESDLISINVPATNTSQTVYARWQSFTTLTISNTVTSDPVEFVDPNKDFTYIVTFTQSDGSALTGPLSCTSGIIVGSGATDPGISGLTLSSGAATFTLKHGQKITVAGVPSNAKIRIVQAGAPGYTTAFANTNVTAGTGNASGTPGAGATDNFTMTANPGTAAFTNSLAQIVPAGIDVGGSDTMLKLLFVILLILTALTYYYRRRIILRNREM